MRSVGADGDGFVRGERVLVIMAKAPKPGAVKTRLASGISHASVTDFYCCLLQDTLTLAGSLTDVEVAIMCPAADVSELEQFLITEARGNEVSVVAQQGEGLAAGLTSVFAHFTNRNKRHVIAFNSDSPHLPNSVLEAAFETLATEDVVMGPTHDGGYYLVGAKASYPTLFASDGLGTSSALQRLLARAQALGLSVGFADRFYDIDVADDLSRLAKELRLDPARAPRTAAWLKDLRDAGNGYSCPLAIATEQKCGPMDPHERAVKVPSAVRVYALGAILLVALSICSRHFGDRGGPLFMAALTVAGIAYLFAVREFFRGPEIPHRTFLAHRCVRTHPGCGVAG